MKMVNDLLRKKFPNLELHASTQMNIHNYDGALLAKKLGFKRVVMARETPIDVIKKIKEEKESKKKKEDADKAKKEDSEKEEETKEEAEAEEKTDNYILPDSSKRILADSEVSGLSKSELRLARNEIFARHGRMFDDQELQDYFNSKSWYRGTIRPEDFSESMLSETEKANIETIKKYE